MEVHSQEVGYDGRQYSYHAQEYGTDKSNSHHDIGQILCGGHARTDTGDEPAVVLHVIGYIRRVEGDGGVEISEEHDQYKVDDRVDPDTRVAGSGQIFAHESGEPCVWNEVCDGHRERQQCHCKDNRDYTCLVDFDWNVGALTAIHFSADYSLRILNRDLSGSLLDHDDPQYNEQCEYGEKDEGKQAQGPFSYSEGHVLQCGGQSCHDTRKDQHGDAVTNTKFVDLFTQPHQEGGACRQD